MRTFPRREGNTSSMRLLLLLGFGLILFILAGCASLNTEAPAPIGPYSLEGPPLHIAGEYKGMPVEGTMDRYAMVGIGKMEIYSANRAAGFFGEARMNIEPSEKARIRGVIVCGEGENILFSMKPTGPDQGIGIGQNEAGDGTLMFFFHSCAEEAQRRFPLVQKSLNLASEKRKQK